MIRQLKPLLSILIVVSVTFGADLSHRIGFVTGSKGSGIGYNPSVRVRDNLSLGVQFRIYDVKDENEFIVYNYYTGFYETTSQKYLILAPMFFSMNYYPFEGKIDNNIAPFFTLQSGPLFTINADEFNDSFFDRWRTAQTLWTAGGHIGIGVDILMMNGTTLTVTAGIDSYPMKGNVDGESQYGGMSIGFFFSRTW